ncbi:MAG: hypothetical protein WBC93_04005 [Sulfitobacter sp.]
MRVLLSLSSVALIAACAPAPDPVTNSLPFFGDGYRYKGDACRRLGEDDFTLEFLDDAADLIGCPENLENLGVFVIDSGAREVARRDGYVIFSVPVR